MLPQRGGCAFPYIPSRGCAWSSDNRKGVASLGKRQVRALRKATPGDERERGANSTSLRPSLFVNGSSLPLELETHRELNLALAVFIAVRRRDAAEGRSETQAVGIVGHDSVSVGAVGGGSVQRRALTEHLRAVEQVEGFRQCFEAISFRELEALRDSQVHILDARQAEGITRKLGETIVTVRPVQR